MVCCAEWKFERRSRTDFSSGVSRSNRSGTRETVSRSKRQAPSLPRASVTCHSVSRPRISGSASQVSATVSRSTPSRRRTASSLAASRSPMPARSSGGMASRSRQARRISDRSASNSSSSIDSRNVRSALRGEPSSVGTPGGGGTLRVLAGGQHLLADHYADGGVVRVGGSGAVAFDQGVEVAQRPSGE